jgi:hypothetical protein
MVVIYFMINFVFEPLYLSANDGRMPEEGRGIFLYSTEPRPALGTNQPLI